MPDEKAHPKLFYRVREWQQRYEINRTREIKRLDWLPIPIDIGTDEYAELLDHPNGAAHFGIWTMIRLTAGRCDPRGSLLRDDGTPHTRESLARLCRITAVLCGEALDRLGEMGRLEKVPFTKQNLSHAAIPSHQSAESPHDVAGAPHNGATSRARATVQNSIRNTPQPPSTEGGRPERRQTRRERQDAEIATEVERSRKHV